MRTCHHLIALLMSVSVACASADDDLTYTDTEIGVSGPTEGGYYCRPATEGNGQLLIHLPGTGADPNDLSSHAFALHACTHGFAAVVPAYNNATAARIACGDDACHDAFHREILFGEEGAPDPIDVAQGESIVDRVTSLLQLLNSEDPDFDWASLASNFDSAVLTDVTLSGHSQGNGHALYWAREQEVRRVVLLGGVADRLGPGDEESDRVTWLKEMSETSATPSHRIFSYLHLDEDALTGVSGSRANLELIGAGPECGFFNIDEDCRVIETPNMGCNAFFAHATVLHEAFGERCRADGLHNNGEAWDQLLFD